MPKLRAKSQEAKLARRNFILSTAEQILRANGLQAFTMNKLAAAADLAKGTLYLYFSCREEIVLAIYTQLHEDWIARFLRAEKAVAILCYDDLCARFYHQFVVDALLVDLAACVSSTIEPHVSTSAWVEAKQTFARDTKRLGGMFCQNFGCDPARGQHLAWAFFAALSGAQQRALEASLYNVISKDLQKLGSVASQRGVFLNIVLPLSPQTGSQNIDK